MANEKKRKKRVVVIGGGCLGVACALSAIRKLESLGDPEPAVLLFDKSVVGAALSSRHSGIVRAANAVRSAAILGKEAIELWKRLKNLWGVSIPYETCGAIWIARDAGGGVNSKWAEISDLLEDVGVRFEQLDRGATQSVCSPSVKLHDNELFFYEPDAMQFDPATVRKGLYEGLRSSKVITHEKTKVLGLETAQDKIVRVITEAGSLDADFVINAAGAWSPMLFNPIGVFIPVSAEKVHVINWTTSAIEQSFQMPIIADYVNLAYFRVWRDGEIHAHEPRKRDPGFIARTFCEYPLDKVSADFINEPSNQSLSYAQINRFATLANRRFRNLDNSVFMNGYASYFDITPDLKFILGPDTKYRNLMHCLGSGQAFKFAPVLGEIISDLICFGQIKNRDLNIDEFSIGRFSRDEFGKFLTRNLDVDNSLTLDVAAGTSAGAGL